MLRSVSRKYEACGIETGQPTVKLCRRVPRIRSAIDRKVSGMQSVCHPAHRFRSGAVALGFAGPWGRLAHRFPSTTSAGG